jgi:exopolysaccharide/PEP-CTERM locus tyrosine autokinase
MSILTEAMAKLSKKPKVENKTRLHVQKPSRNEGIPEQEILSNAPKQDQLNANDVDVLLDGELTDFLKSVSGSRHKDIDIDIDLTSQSLEGSAFIDTQVMSINPLKSFSQQSDVDLNRLRENGFITPDTTNSLLFKTFRILKRPLLNNVMGKGATVVDNANMIMLTSSFSGEGKTFSAINLAMSIAMEKDKRVLLIDADVNKPSHHELFGIETEYGLTDLLKGNVDDISNIIYKTNIPSLSLMFAGNRTEYATELFASKAMEDFVTELSSRYEDRVIIFDSAPLLLTTEAGVLASHMGQVIVVVEAEETPKNLVNNSLEMLNNKIVLMLLNKTREKSDLGNYGYSKYDDQ